MGQRSPAESAVQDSPPPEQLKAAAAARALELVRPGMVVGLGSGTTTRYFVEGLGRLVGEGLQIEAIPSSRATAALATNHGITLTDDADALIDLAVDGADEIDPRFQLIKGKGGALVREKIVAASARRFIVIADESKLVPRLGVGALPVEIAPLLWRHTARRLQGLGATWVLRMDGTGPLETDNGNFILDLSFLEPFSDPAALAAQLAQTVGVVGHGLFIDMAHACIVAGANGVRVLGSLDP